MAAARFTRKPRPSRCSCDRLSRARPTDEAPILSGLREDDSLHKI